MSTITNRVDALFAEWDKPDSPGCALAVVKNGGIIYKRGYGMADLERNVAITPDFLFDLGSTGKQFTATVIAILENQGLLSFNDSLRKYVPEMPDYAEKITIRHLIYHTSGLRDYLTLMMMAGLPFESYYSEEALLDLIVRQRELNFDPGEENLYSNSGYFMLGIVAQRVTGKHLIELIREHIYEPLGMTHSTFNKDYRPIVGKRASSYAPVKGGVLKNEVSLTGGLGDGPIYSSVEDLYLWDQNFYANRLNHAQTDLIEILQTQEKLNNGTLIEYAFGLEISSYRGFRTVSHGGSWAGYRSELLRFPEQKFSVICLSNLSSMMPEQLARRVADIYLEKEFNLPAAEVLEEQPETNDKPFDPVLLELYTGKYHCPELDTDYILSVQGNQFYLQRSLYAAPERLQSIVPGFFKIDELQLQFSGSDLVVSQERVKNVRFTKTDSQ